MLIYMLLNHATDMVYIGQTSLTLEKRVLRHRDLRSKKNFRLNVALKDFNWNCWEAIVLEYCNSQEHLDECEKHWIELTNACDVNVGYNVQRTSSRVFTLKPTKQKKRTEMTYEERERFRAWGRKGAAKAKENLAARNR